MQQARIEVVQEGSSGPCVVEAETCEQIEPEEWHLWRAGPFLNQRAATQAAQLSL